MTLKLYAHPMSQPCRSVMLFLECANVPHENIIVNPRKGTVSFFPIFDFFRDHLQIPLLILSKFKRID